MAIFNSYATNYQSVGGWVSLFLQQKPLLSTAVPVAVDAVASFVASLRALSDAQVAEATAALAEFGDEERHRALGSAAKVAVSGEKNGDFDGESVGNGGKNGDFWMTHIGDLMA
jgi:hypothetical protein